MSMPQYQDLQTGPLDYNNYGSLSAVDSNKGQPFPNVNSSSPVSSSSSYNNNGTYGSSTMQSTFPPQDASSTIPHGSVPSSLAASLPGPYPGATPSSGIIGRQTGYSGSSVAPKFSRPSRIVNLTPHPRYPGQVSVFRWVVRHIYMNPGKIDHVIYIHTFLQICTHVSKYIYTYTYTYTFHFLIFVKITLQNKKTQKTNKYPFRISRQDNSI